MDAVCEMDILSFVDVKLEVGEEEEEEEEGPPEKIYVGQRYTCDHCHIPWLGSARALLRHVVCCHTVAFFAKQQRFVEATDEEVDLAVQDLCQEWLFPDPKNPDTFHCSFCHEPVVGDKKFHLLLEHDDFVECVVQSGRATLSSEIVGVSARAKLNERKRMRQRILAKVDFLRKREYFRINNVQPPFTMPFLIRQAITESEAKQLTAKEIGNWLMFNFCYYQNSPKIKNSIYNSLASSKCFVRVDLGGREGAWRVKDREFYQPNRRWSHVKYTSVRRKIHGQRIR